MLLCGLYILGLFLGFCFGRMAFKQHLSGTLYFRQFPNEDKTDLFLEVKDIKSITGEKRVIFSVSEMKDSTLK